MRTIRYSAEALEALEHELEHQGGAVLPDPCVPHDIVYKKQEGYEKNKTIRNMTCGCMNETRMVSLYDPGDLQQGGSGFITACAVCDSMGLWPRFAKALLNDEPEQLDDPEEDDDA
jgi:hypothetical protein